MMRYPIKKFLTKVLSQNKIGRRLLVPILLFSAFITAISMGLGLYREYQSDIFLLENQIEEIKSAQLPELVDAYWNLNSHEVSYLLKAIIKKPFIEQVSLEKPLNRIAQQLNLEVIKSETEDFKAKIYYIPLVFPSPDGDIQLGTLKLVTNHGLILEGLWGQFIQHLGMIFFKAVLVSAFFLFLVERVIVRRLERISDYARSVDAERIEGTTAMESPQRLTKPDELDHMIDAVNGMRQRFYGVSLENQHKNRELLLFDKFKNQYLSDVSRELKTQISGIVSISEGLIKQGQIEGNEESDFDQSLIEANERRIYQLLEDSLDYDKLKYKQITLYKSPINIKSIIDVAVASTHVFLKDVGVELRNEVPSELPLVFVDELRVQQILYHVLTNAMKRTYQGTITIRAEEINRRVCLQVEDTGSIIPQKELEQILGYFDASDGFNKKQPLDSGVGLSIANQLVELHGGQITIDSEQGKPTCISFVLPLATKISPRGGISDGQLPPTQVSGPHKIEEEGFYSSYGTGKTFHHQVLVVDDDPLVRRVINNVLSVENYDVRLASSNEDALDLLKLMTPDLVILDPALSKSGEIDLCRRIREDHSSKDLPIILLNQRSEYRDQQVKNTLEANDYLEKPVYKHELLARVQGQIQMKQANQRITSLLAFTRQLNQIKDLSSLLALFFEHLDQNVYFNAALMLHGEEIIFQSGNERLASELASHCIEQLQPDASFENTRLIKPSPGYVLFATLKGFAEYSLIVFRSEIHGAFSETTRKYLENIYDEIYEVRNRFERLAEDVIPREAILMIKKMMNQITFIKSASPFCEITMDGIEGTIEIPISMQEIELYFGDSDLVRVHRQFFVIPRKAWGIRKKNPKDYEIIFGKSVIPVGRTYLKRLKSKHADLFDK